jgi:hypothetical protein
MTYLDPIPNYRPPTSMWVLDKLFMDARLSLEGRLDRSAPESALERKLERFQRKLSDMSMHLPYGFSLGLGRQFSRMLSDNAWDDEDPLPSDDCVDTLIHLLIATGTNTRPGVGTDGRGSVSAYWHSEEGRLTIDFMPDLSIRILVSRTADGGDVVRGVLRCKANQVMQFLRPYGSEIWFD